MAANCRLVFLKCKIMRVRYFLLVVVSLLALAGAQAQVYVPAPSPSAMAVDVDGNETELAFGDEYSGEAPVTVRFYANAPEVDGYSLTCTWEFFKEGILQGGRGCTIPCASRRRRADRTAREWCNNRYAHHHIHKH